MIFSRWNPATGGYDYYESPGALNINDDLPTPDLPMATKIGVPSIEAGRPVPPGAQRVGEGEVAVGLVAPVDATRIIRRTRSLGGFDAGSSPAVLWTLAGVAGAAALWFVYKKKR